MANYTSFLVQRDPKNEKRPRPYFALNASAQCTHENMSSQNHRLHDRVVDAVIAQFCTDFDCVRGSSLQGLREMIVRYVSELSIIARDEANCAGRTQVNVLDVFMALGRDAITFEHLLHQKASNQDGGLVRLPGKLSTTRKPKLWHKISNTTDAVPSYIPSYLQVLPSTDTRFLDTNIMLAVGSENIVDHVCSSKAEEHKNTAKHIDALRSDWDIQNPDWQHSVRDSSSLMHYESLKRLPYQNLLVINGTQLRPRAHDSSFRQHSNGTSREALLAQKTISGISSVYETGHLEH